MPKNISTLFFYLLFICYLQSLSSPAGAQQLNALKSFTGDTPLSFQAVPVLDQDEHGFIWFGSNTGLHRYDGYETVDYHYDESTPHSLSPGGISSLLFDSHGQMWVGTHGGGIDLFDRDSQIFKSIDSTTAPLALTDDNVTAIIEDSNANLWIATSNGVNILFREPKQQHMKHILPLKNDPNSLADKKVIDLLQTQSQTIWAATNQGISVFDLQGNFIRNIHPSEHSSSNASSNMILSLFQQKDGLIWIGTMGGGLIKYNPADFSFQEYKVQENDPTSITSNTVKKIFEDSNSKVWIATDKGLSIYNPKKDNFYRFNHVVGDPNSLANDVVLDIFEDKDGMIWIGTFGGANLWDPNVTTFTRYTPLNQPVLSNAHISSFSQSSRQHIYVATYGGGIYQLNKSTDTLSKVELNDYFKDSSITTLMVEPGVLWVGTRSSGIHRVELPSKKITVFEHDPKDSSTISANAITSIIRDHRGQIWAATFGRGINRLNRDNSFSRFTQSSTDPSKGPSSNTVMQLLSDKAGYIWLANYSGGINRFDLETEQFIHIKHDKNDPKSLSSNIALVIFKDHKENLWVGTLDSGINIINKEDQLAQNWRFEHLDMVDGMINTSVYGISEDPQNNIWYTSGLGISRYSPLTLEFTHFGRRHGLVVKEFNHGAMYRDIDNVLYFGGTKGFNSIDPKTIKLKSSTPVTHLTNILKLNEPMIFDQALSKIEELTFEYSDRLISFEYVGLNYADPEPVRYRYRLHGFDPEWIDAGKLKRSTYTNLPAGDYKFEVIASADEKNWTQKGRSINITVEPAPWQTWWAYMLYAAMTAIALLSYSKLVNRKLQAEQQQKTDLKQQVEEKTKEFQLKNVELEQANKQLENAATTDKLTGVKSRRYLDIYIEQATRLMSQIHLNILPVQRNVLPRLYLLMVRVSDTSKVNNSQLVNLTDLLLYSRNDDDLVIRWSDDTFAVIGYEKDENARELASRLTDRFGQIFDQQVSVDMAFSFYPFNFEQPMALSWDQVSVLTEFGLNHVKRNQHIDWLGLYAPKEQPFDYLEALKLNDLEELAKLVKIRQSN